MCPIIVAGGSAPPPSPADGAAAIRAKALEIGFHAVGFAPAQLGPEVRARLDAFLAAGMQGEMGWLADRAEQRAHPQALWPEAVSVVALGMNYGPEADPLSILGQKDRAGISVYARHKDYHDIVKKRLKMLGRWMMETWREQQIKVFVDTAPVAEKPLAQQAGLGWQGKHSNLVSREFGSWLFLGEIYTTLDLAPTGAESDHCGRCQRCLSACPTDAFVGPYRLDARRCISYLTIEHKGPIPEEFRVAMGNRIYGCDDCLAVCPWNKFASATAEPGLIAREDLTAPKLAELATLDDAAFRALFSGSPIKRIGRDRFIRNVLNAIGNSGLAELRPVAQSLAEDPSEIVADSARWATARLASQETAA